MGKSYTHNLEKLDYASVETLRKTLKRVFPELDEEGLERRFAHEKKYIGYTKTKDDLTGATIWNAP